MITYKNYLMERPDQKKRLVEVTDTDVNLMRLTLAPGRRPWELFRIRNVLAKEVETRNSNINSIQYKEELIKYNKNTHYLVYPKLEECQKMDIMGEKQYDIYF